MLWKSVGESQGFSHLWLQCEMSSRCRPVFPVWICSHIYQQACAIGWHVDTEGVFVCCGSVSAGPCVRMFLIPVRVERPASQLSPHPQPWKHTHTCTHNQGVVAPSLKFLSLTYPCVLPCRSVPEQLRLEPAGLDEVLDWSKSRAPCPTGNSFAGLLGWGNGF